MKIVDRYLAFGYLRPLLFCTAVFVLMFVFVDSLNNLDEFIKQETPVKIIAAYYAALVPLVIQQIMPASILFAALYFLGHLNRNNEITAMRAGGLSPWQVLKPLLVIAFVVSMLMLALSERVTPNAAITSAAIKEGIIEVGPDAKDSGKALKNVTLVSEGNRMVFARDLRIDTNTLFEVIVLEHNEDLTLKAKTTARRAVWEDGRWTFYEVVRYELDENGEIIGKPQNMPKALVSIKETPLDFMRQGTETHFMNYAQLKKYIDNTRIGGQKASTRLVAELQHKLA